MNIKALSVSATWRTVLLILIVAAADFLLSLMNLGMGLDSGLVPQDPNALEFIRFAGLPALAPLGAVALIWRRRFPRIATAVAAVIGGLSFSGIAFFVALYLLAKRRLDWWVGVFIILSLVAEEFLGIERLGWEGMLLGAVVLAVIAIWGAYRGQRSRLRESTLSSLRERAEHAERERAAEAGRSKLAERHRIAREMHDTLAHRMSLVAVQAAALQVDAPDTETASAAKVIRETAHAALGELREVLGVLREDGTVAESARANTVSRTSESRTSESSTTELHNWETVASEVARGPSGIPQIAGLVTEWRQAGIAVDYSPLPELPDLSEASVGLSEFSELSTLAEGIPDPVSRAAYRVVQEGITNVARHAPEATAVVSLQLADTTKLQDREPASASPASKELQVAVRNERVVGSEPASGAGVGLIGLAERLQLLGGSLDHGVTESGFILLARIPFSPVNPEGQARHEISAEDEIQDQAGAVS